MNKDLRKEKIKRKKKKGKEKQKKGERFIWVDGTFFMIKRKQSQFWKLRGKNEVDPCSEVIKVCLIILHSLY